MHSAPFAGSGDAGHLAASIDSHVETATLNDAEVRRADTISTIADYPARRVADLPTWNCRPA
ncbi:hypothetical protein ASE90_13040 [Sphingomonas sp. Leaf67]|uniref:hypothetical protein n=1 Tax=unclassified Sphingomonas TaxID=196159 RepID=UPI0006F9FA34|nr:MULTISPECIES: hypothetical protein [unclassified Sphingomonas]KQN71396.1 hypothetical protein ASE91_05805 [Sphingomonas sp. Leaf62]KQN81498.1 hypothetical protein ASE90_13040 [Sphingomonas sp. Leaf67]